MSADFLLELLSEEIPARMQEKACADLARLFAAEIAKAGLVADAIETWATPRRLALIARGLPLVTRAVAEELKGPRADAPAQALAGFLGKTGLTREQLVERADAKGHAVLYAVIEKPGRPTAGVLAAAVPAVVRGFPWPKAMRWGAASASTASLRWVRPLQGIVALLGEDVVPIEVDGIVAGAATLGHRFHHPGPITIGSADDYAFKLRAAHVILDPAERRAIIAEGAARAAAAVGLALVPDEGLVAENAGLTEWPVPLLGRFDPAFLAVPREVIQLTMRTNQKYFACVDAAGALAPAFICTANIAATDGGAGIVAGNQKVLAARLADAKFFWEQDLKVPLAEWAGRLDRIVFHEKLGTVADKVERVAKLARWLVEEGIVPPASPPYVERSRDTSDAGDASGGPSSALGEGGRSTLADMAEQAARLAKADLVTGMVGEFPELQGVMGGYYARAAGLPDAVADAIRDHYKPVGQGDEVPTAPLTVAVSLADKLDTLFSFFAIDERPTGSKDPFALRRAGLGVIALILRQSLPVRLASIAHSYFALLAYEISFRRLDGSDQAGFLAGHVYDGWTSGQPVHLNVDDIPQKTQLSGSTTYYSQEYQPLIRQALETHNYVMGMSTNLMPFLTDRLKVQQREAGVRHDLIDAVFALGGEDDLVRLLARVTALQAFIASEDGVNLLAGYKRAANILRIEEKKDGASFAPTTAIAYAPDTAEAALLAALDRAEPEAEGAVAAEDFGRAMTALSSLRVAVDAFFETVTVNDADAGKRASRLGLLARIRDAVHRVADFSKIEG